MAFIADTAKIVGDVRLGKGVSILYGAVVRGDFAPITVGDMSNIQDNCVVHSEADRPCVIGSQVTIGHGAIVHSSTIGNRVLIGMNATVLHGCEIGDDVIVAAGAAVRPGTKVPAGTLWAGVPAGQIRELTDADKKSIIQYANEYVEMGE